MPSLFQGRTNQEKGVGVMLFEVQASSTSDLVRHVFLLHLAMVQCCRSQPNGRDSHTSSVCTVFTLSRAALASERSDGVPLYVGCRESSLQGSWKWTVLLGMQWAARWSVSRNSGNSPLEHTSCASTVFSPMQNAGHSALHCSWM